MKKRENSVASSVLLLLHKSRRCLVRTTLSGSGHHITKKRKKSKNRILKKQRVVPTSKKVYQMESIQDLEHSIRYFILFGKLIGLYPSRFSLIRAIPLLLSSVTLVDLVGFLVQPTSNRFSTAAEICGRIGSPQFYALGTFCYFYTQRCHKRLVQFYERWKSIPITTPDKGLSLFAHLTSGLILTSAILENICFHFKLFPVFEKPDKHMSAFEVYYVRSHGYWGYLIPFTPYQATLLMITNKLALYAWNYSDIMVIIMCRAVRFRFDDLQANLENIEPLTALKQYEDLLDLMKLLEDYLSPLVFGCFYLDFYATCMQLHMWLSPSEHKHILHTIYLLWAFVHLVARMFLLTYQASKLYESSIKFRDIARIGISQAPTFQVTKQILRIEFSQRRPMAISGLKCFFITKKFLLTLVYVAFSFEIFLIQSDSIKC